MSLSEQCQEFEVVQAELDKRKVKWNGKRDGKAMDLIKLSLCSVGLFDEEYQSGRVVAIIIPNQVSKWGDQCLEWRIRRRRWFECEENGIKMGWRSKT